MWAGALDPARTGVPCGARPGLWVTGVTGPRVDGKWQCLSTRPAAAALPSKALLWLPGGCLLPPRPQPPLTPRSRHPGHWGALGGVLGCPPRGQLDLRWGATRKMRSAGEHVCPESGGGCALQGACEAGEPGGGLVLGLSLRPVS